MILEVHTQLWLKHEGLVTLLVSKGLITQDEYKKATDDATAKFIDQYSHGLRKKAR